MSGAARRELGEGGEGLGEWEAADGEHCWNREGSWAKEVRPPLETATCRSICQTALANILPDNVLQVGR